MSNKNNIRVHWVDGIRGIAILLMIIFHFCYDLRYFGWVDWDVPNGPNWWPFRYLILSLFIFTIGISLTLAHHPQVQWKKFNKRLGQLAISALAVTIMSFFLFPTAWIYFGILHFIATSSLIAACFIKTPKISLLLGLGILLFYNIGILSNEFPFSWFDSFLPAHTEDYVPLFPWLGLALLGVAFGRLVNLQSLAPYFQFLPKWLIWMGKHGLIIYLLHQPLFFALLTPLSYL